MPTATVNFVALSRHNSNDLTDLVFDFFPKSIDQISIRISMFCRLNLLLQLTFACLEVPMKPTKRLLLVFCNFEFLDRDLVCVHFTAGLFNRFDIHVVSTAGESPGKHEFETVCSELVARETELMVRQPCFLLPGFQRAS